MAIITCPECCANISDKADKCIYCGFPLDYLKKDQISCPECGEKISERVDHCMYCGFPITMLKEHPVLQKSDKNGLTREQVQVTKVTSESNATILPLLLFILIIAVIGIYSSVYFMELIHKQKGVELVHSEEKVDNNTTNNEQGNQNGSESETRQAPTENKLTNEDRIANIVVTHTYYWYEDGNSASISFQPEGNSSVGTMVLRGSILTLEFRYEGDRNAIDYVLSPDQICSFVYKYNIRGKYIHATFVNSSCNYQAKDRTFTFYESDNNIWAYTSQGEMVFKP